MLQALSASSPVLHASILNGAASPDRSSRFTPFRTATAVELLQREGFELIKTEAVKDGRRKDSPVNVYGKHMVQMALPGVQSHDEGRPLVLLSNANDGSSSVAIRAGFFRFVCSNGLVIGKSLLSVRQRHAGLMVDDLLRRVNDVAGSIDRMYQKIEQWGAINLTGPQRIEFARLAAQLRFGNDHYQPKLLLEARRSEDEGSNLWKTFNVIQENATRGGFAGESVSGRRVRARGLAGLDTNTAFNEQLWTLAEDVAEAV
jgi:hypothetical protein